MKKSCKSALLLFSR